MYSKAQSTWEWCTGCVTNQVVVVKPAQVQILHIAVLSQASVLGCSQLNRQKLRVGSCTEEVCKWFNCPVQGPISDTKLALRRYRIDLHHCFARALSRPIWQWRKLYCTCSLILSFHSNLLSLQYINFWGRILGMRRWTSLCKPLMPDVVAPKRTRTITAMRAQQTYLPNLAWWTVTRRTLKNHKIGGWALARV